MSKIVASNAASTNKAFARMKDLRPSVISGLGATLALTAAQSGSTVLLDRAAGTAVTLPAATAANVGVTYNFICSTAITSNSTTVTTAAATDLYSAGSYTNTWKSATAPTIFSPNGSSNYIFTMNGSTQGGLVGTSFSVTCTAANTWVLTGVAYGSGTLATGFSG